LNEGIRWHVTTEQEQADLRHLFPKFKNQVQLIGNIPRFDRDISIDHIRAPDQLTMGTVSLITPMKNIHLLLQELVKTDRNIHYHIYGPVSDKRYWERCLAITKEIPKNVKVAYHGPIVPSETRRIMQGLDVYIQPSKSENFGHSIFEAFNLGIPVITSNQTPWKELRQRSAGWDVNVEDPDALLNAVTEAMEMNNELYRKYCIGARKIAEDYMENTDFKASYNNLFN